MKHSKPKTTVAVWRHIMVVGWVCGLLTLGTRSLISRDARYGFGMFGHKVVYSVHYQWVHSDGTRVKMTDHPGLRGKALNALKPDKPHKSYYSTGAMKVQVTGYAKYLAKNHAPEGAVLLKAIARHRRYDQKRKTRYVLKIPVEPQP